MARKRKASVSIETFDEFLAEQGMLQSTEDHAVKELIAEQLAAAMAEQGLTSLQNANTTTTIEAETIKNMPNAGQDLTFLAQRTLLPGQSLAREYSQGDISSFPAIGAVSPDKPGARGYSEPYRELLKEGFAGWRLSVEGAVDRPVIDFMESAPKPNSIHRAIYSMTVGGLREN